MKLDREDIHRRLDAHDRRIDRVEDELGKLDEAMKMDRDNNRRQFDSINATLHLLVQRADEGRDQRNVPYTMLVRSYEIPLAADGYGQQLLSVHTRSTRDEFPIFDDTQSKGCINREEEVQNAQLQEEIIEIQIGSVESFLQTPKEHFETQTILEENVEESTAPLLKNQAHSIPSEGGSNAVPQSLLTNSHTHTPKYSVNEGGKQSIWLEMKCVLLQSIKLEGMASNALDPKCNSEQLRSSEVVFEIQWLLVVGSGLWLSKKLKLVILLCGWKVMLQGEKEEVNLMQFPGLIRGKITQQNTLGVVEQIYSVEAFHRTPQAHTKFQVLLKQIKDIIATSKLNECSVMVGIKQRLRNTVFFLRNLFSKAPSVWNAQNTERLSALHVLPATSAVPGHTTVPKSLDGYRAGSRDGYSDCSRPAACTVPLLPTLIAVMHVQCQASACVSKVLLHP